MVSSSLKLPFSRDSRCQIYKKKENKVTFLKSNLNSILMKNSNKSELFLWMTSFWAALSKISYFSAWI